MHSNTDYYLNKLKLAVLIPCHNESETIETVIWDFRNILPEAIIYVCDNNSNDGTDKKAKDSGAVVMHELRKGKGYAVRRLLNEVDADFYILVDGDSTYSASEVKNLLSEAIIKKAHMVVGVRIPIDPKKVFRHLHGLGNKLITKTINLLFNSNLKDVLSGYRVLSKHYAKVIPFLSRGFEIETEMTLNALEFDLQINEIPISYGCRPHESVSKLNTYRDGLLIFRTIFNIFRDCRPMLFFGIVSILLISLGLFLGIPVIIDFLRTGMVSRFPTAILSASLELLAFQMLGVGLILDTIARQRRFSQQFWLKHFDPDLSSQTKQMKSGIDVC
jgi:glycosyltransferase involved in cell wall biosynthesis